MARWLGFKTVVATVGTRDGQNLGLMQAGGRRVPGVDPIVTPKYDDEVAVMSFDPASPAPTFASLIRQVEEACRQLLASQTV